MEIKRDSYLNRLLAKKQNGLVKVITGVRRCGKSYLLFKLFYNHLITSGVDDLHIIKIEFDRIENTRLRDALSLYNHIRNLIIDDAPYYVLLDEIQLVPEFESVLNSLLHYDNVDCYVTGSNSKFLSSDVISEFRGRGDELRIFPLSFSEYFSVFEGTKEEAWQSYQVHGGMPQCVTIPSDLSKETYLKDLFNMTYILDIINRNKLRGNREISELTDVMASSIGSLVNPTNITNTFNSVYKAKLSRNTVVAYLNYLEDAFLIEKVQRYNVKSRRYINTPSKYYFVDVGLRNARLNFRQQDEGFIMENIIYNELKSRGYSIDVGEIEVSTKNELDKIVRKQLEVDFVVNRGSSRCYIQSSLEMNSEEKIIQEKASLLRIPDSFKKIIICKDSFKPWYDQNGILMLSLLDFLLNPKSI